MSLPVDLSKEGKVPKLPFESETVARSMHAIAVSTKLATRSNKNPFGIGLRRLP